jgi:D-alanyl-D-alanine dipeptidase
MVAPGKWGKEMAELSGPQWCARFPGSDSTDDLIPAFRKSVNNFVEALKAAGATVTVSATLRPPERAYLMHWCWMIATTGQDPAKIPAMPGVNIRWAHPTLADSKAAARAMKTKYGMAHVAALNSRHTQGKAIDMTIRWTGDLVIKNAVGKTKTITSTPRTGSNADLIAVGATYGVIKLITDPPHWSTDGH